MPGRFIGELLAKLDRDVSSSKINRELISDWTTASPDWKRRERLVQTWVWAAWDWQVLRREAGMLRSGATGSWAGKQISYQRRVTNGRTEIKSGASEWQRDEEGMESGGMSAGPPARRQLDKHLSLRQRWWLWRRWSAGRLSLVCS